jgi:hypothetical protein
MATTRLSDVIVPEIYQGYMNIQSPVLTALWQSGIIVENALLTNIANGASGVAHIPFWRDLNASDVENLGSDDPSVKSVPSKITAGKQIGIVARMNKSWSTMNLVNELSGSDPVAAISSFTNNWWSRRFQARLVASCLGIYYDNVASNAGDMVYDITTGGAPADANRFGGVAAIRAMTTLGDAMSNVSAIAMHSVIYGRALEQNLIQFIQPSNLLPQIPTYQGKVVILDDGMPVETVGSNSVYTTILFGPGVFAYGNGSPAIPVEVFRDPSSGNGAGQDTLFERRTTLVHPFGFSCDDAFVAGDSGPTIEELLNPALWSRVVERKNVAMAFLRTNG